MVEAYAFGVPEPSLQSGSKCSNRNTEQTATHTATGFRGQCPTEWWGLR